MIIYVNGNLYTVTMGFTVVFYFGFHRNSSMGWNDHVTYPLVMTNSSPWYRWPIEIDGLPNLKMVMFHGYGQCSIGFNGNLYHLWDLLWDYHIILVLYHLYIM
jgi:hypothetical protein